MTTKAREIAKNPLCVELGKVGRLLHPLDPSKLLGRTAILTCPAVRRRVGESATEAERAQAASTAIRIAVKRVNPPRDRTIAEAMFGFGDFDGKPVTQRRTQLEGVPHVISRDEYSKRRPWALESVAFNLETPGLEPPDPELDERNRARRPKHVSFLTHLSSRMLRLGFSGLAILFAKHDRDEERPAELVAHRLGEDLITQLVHVLEVSYYHSGHMLGEARGEFDPLEATSDLLRHGEVLTQFAPDERQAISDRHTDLLALFPYTLDELVTLISSTNSVGSEIARLHQIPDDLFERWLRWNEEMNPIFKDAPKAEPHQLAPFENVVQHCFGADKVIARRIDYDPVIPWLARTYAVKRLAAYYTTEEWAPDSSGVPLRVQIDRYFDQTVMRLVA